MPFMSCVQDDAQKDLDEALPALDTAVSLTDLEVSVPGIDSRVHVIVGQRSHA